MDVIVIGCGAAGLAAMRELHLKGLKVLGLEAADRIGGRILTVPYGEANIDLGAAWCHGDKKDNKVYELANPLNLLDRPEPDNKWYLQSNGELVSPDTAESILKVLDDAVAKANKYTTQSISECVRNTVHSNEILKKDNALSQTFVEWYERFHEVGGQDDPKARKSLRWLIEFWNKDGVMLNWKGKGYKTIIDILLNKYPDPSKEIPLNILLNKEVENISWGGSEDQLVQITCKDGSVYTAKSVIVTIPVAVLKEKHNQLFNPPLPVDKVKTITNFNVCVLDKIYIEFEKPWWPATPLDFTFLWREEDKAKFTGADKWITEIYGMISVIAQPNLLLAWINGTGAEMMEERSEEEVQNGIQKLIDTILKKQFNVSPIKKILRTQWGSNPYARGAYVYRTVNSEENGGSAITLSEPLYNSNIFPTVCFAGEATSHHNHSDAHGAIESGIREAERLIESFQRL